MTYWQQIKQFLLAVDQLVNTLIGLIVCPFARIIFWADESISSMTYRAHRDSKRYGYFMYVINALFFWQVEHCKKAYEAELNGRHLPPEMRPNSNKSKD